VWGIVTSPFLLVAAFIALLDFDNWSAGEWAPRAFELIPSLLGFSLGTYAILFSIMSNRLKRALKASHNPNGIPYLDEINATFFHFIFVQCLALLLAIVSGLTLPSGMEDVLGPLPIEIELLMRGAWLFVCFIGSVLTTYSILLAIASALAVYRIAGIVDPHD
jgi:hypothetical protein